MLIEPIRKNGPFHFLSVLWISSRIFFILQYGRFWIFNEEWQYHPYPRWSLDFAPVKGMDGLGLVSFITLTEMVLEV